MDNFTEDELEESLKRRQIAAEQDAASTLEILESVPEKLDLTAQSRWRITNVVLGILVGAVAVLLLLVILQSSGVCWATSCDYTPGVESTFDLLKTIILPLTTLVFGHYLGSKKSE